MWLLRPRGPSAPACLLLALLAVVACAEPPPTPDLILTDGRIFTADSTRPRAEALAVAGDTVLAVGSTDSVAGLAGEGTRTIALDGRLVVPGLNDAHGHVFPSVEAVRLAFGSAAGGMPDPSRGEVLAALRAAVDTLPAGTWIRGTIGERVLFDRSMDRRPLDRIAPEHPVMLSGWTGHGYLANGAALDELDFRDGDPDPPGGWLGRRGSGGELDGWLWEGASIQAVRRLAELASAERRAAAVRAHARPLPGWGVTSFQQMSAALHVDELDEAVAAADVPVRWTAYRWGLPDSAVEEVYRRTPPADSALSAVRHAGVKWMLDATPIDRYAVLREPYADRPGWHGRLNYTPAELRAILAGALEAGEQPAFHAAGDSTIALLLSTMRDLAPDSAWRRLRVRLEHGDGLAPDLIGAAADLGVVLVQNPLHLQTGVLGERFGERTAWIQPLRSALEAGIPVALGADAGGPGLDPWLNVMLAVRHPANPEEALTREQAIVAYTRGAAYAERRENEKGTIAPGMLADLAVLSQDVFEVPLEALPSTRSVLTVVGGQVVLDELETED